ncbi:MAG: amidase family protein, partial [Acidobacteriota bacterium]
MRVARALLCASGLLVFSVAVAAAQAVELDSATIAQLAAAMDAGTLTSEKLVQLSLARIDAYDDQGPKLNALITLNPKALEQARALDAERKAKGKRSPLHGIPVILKDNFDTFDLATTGGSLLLEGSLPPDDAFVVKKLRDAGAIILAKANMSEFASGGAFSSLGGQSHNPHDPARSPSGSSGGTGVSIAAGYATVGLGTDTGGSVRGPSTANGVVGLKPTHGLLSRDGIIPLALSFDTGGPLARNVADIAAVLGVMTGVDPADAATKKSEGHFDTDYTKFLKADALKGARIGIARDFMGQDEEVDWVIEAALAAMRAAGATIVDVRYPKWLLDAKGEYYTAVRYPEFPVQIATYLATLKPGFPKSLAEMIEKSDHLVATRADGAGPNPPRWTLFKREAASGTMDDYRYTSVRDFALPLVRATTEGILT